MFKVSNFLDNDDVDVIAQLGVFRVIQWRRDLSVSHIDAQTEWFASQMNVRRRQVVAELSRGSVVVQAGAMEWTVGNVEVATGVKSAGDLLGKSLRGAVTKESAIKPEYRGSGILVLEPTYHHVILLDVGAWNNGIVLDNGIFLASEATLEHKIVARSNISSAIAGGEGLFNLYLTGTGVVCLESPCPYEELIQVDLKDDVLKIDGNMAMAWSQSLRFTVERTTKSLIGSATSGEGLVNVYRGTGRVLVAPMRASHILMPPMR